jgi:hypothetical protein
MQQSLLVWENKVTEKELNHMMNQMRNHCQLVKTVSIKIKQKNYHTEEFCVTTQSELCISKIRICRNNQTLYKISEI